MKHIEVITIFAFLSTACSAATSFEGNYTRQNATAFEVAQNMNSAVTIEKKDGNYLIIMHSTYGDTIQNSKVNEGKLLANDLVIEKKGEKLKMYYVDNPQVEFTFKKDGK